MIFSRIYKLITLSLLCYSFHTLSAQNNNFDLSSQRAESQQVVSVSGQKLQHYDLVINPSPQQLSISQSGQIKLCSSFSIKDKKHKFSSALSFLPTHNKGIPVVIDFGTKIAKRKKILPISGAYTLHIDKKGVQITGYDETGAFYGIQTLRQILNSEIAKSGELPYMTINDYPNLPNRGVVEGFYGTPWSQSTRLSLIDFYGQNKMNTYIYGPKDDPYHSCPNWRLPYPPKEEQNIKDLVQACKKNYVNFVWAIHPGQDIKWNAEDYNNLLAKFNKMYDLGVRNFAIFFDDISGEGTNPYKQTELLNRLTKDFVNIKKDVSPLCVCPTDYSRLWANPSENGSLAIYGRTLDPSIKVFWTGDVVCSDLTKSTCDWVNSRIKRPNFFWWNFPVTDYARHILLQGPVYGLDTLLTAKDVCGLVSNPMEHGEASKLALYGVADYTWNTKHYNPLDNWERGLINLMPQAHQYYRTFAIHSADTENGYRRAESWETSTFSLKNWNKDNAQTLQKEFQKIVQAPDSIIKKCTNKNLVHELKPWLIEFKKLGERGLRTLELMKLYHQNASAEIFWKKFVDNLMSPEDRKKYNAHKSGTMKLQPFYENAMDDMGHGFLKRITGHVPKDYRGIGSFSSIYTPAYKLMLDNDTSTYFTSGISQKSNDWIGLDLRTTRDLKEIEILQGRNSKDDVDYFDHATLEASQDGQKWVTLIPEIKQQYIIHWKGNGQTARYVRLRRLDSPKTNYASVRIFNVNPVHLNELPFKIEATHLNHISYVFDDNLHTAYQLNGEMTMSIAKSTNSVIVLSGKISTPLTCTLRDRKGNVLSSTKINTSYAVIPTNKGKVYTITLSGENEIYEIIQK